MLSRCSTVPLMTEDSLWAGMMMANYLRLGSGLNFLGFKGAKAMKRNWKSNRNKRKRRMRPIRAEST